jgi:hypothetical protein
MISYVIPVKQMISYVIYLIGTFSALPNRAAYIISICEFSTFDVSVHSLEVAIGYVFDLNLTL